MATGPHDDPLIMRKHKLKLYGNVATFTGLAKTFLQRIVPGKRMRDRQRECREENVR